MNNGGTSQQGLVGKSLNENFGNMWNGLIGYGCLGIGYGAIWSALSWCEMGCIIKITVYLTWLEI